MRIVLYCLIALLALCNVPACFQKEKPVVRINDIRVDREEFLNAYRASPFVTQGNSGFKDFLDQFITKKLILDEAERRGLDKDAELLAGIQQYWEQELLKLTLSRVRMEISAVPVTDAEVWKYYEQKGAEFFAGRPLDEVKMTIREFLVRERQKETMQKWLDEMKKNASIEIDYAHLGI